MNKRYRLPTISPAEVRDTVNWLQANNGCYHKRLWTDDDGREWDIVIGWHDAGAPYPGDEEKYYVSDESWYITWAIRYQTAHNAMSTDMDMDFLIPQFKDGDCYDLSEAIPRTTNWRAVAATINRNARDMRSLVRKYKKDLDLE